MNKIGDNELDEILSTLQEIEHIEIIRIGTRAIVVNPMRITDDLINIFKKYKPLWINTHFNHPRIIENMLTKSFYFGQTCFNFLLSCR